MHQISSSLANDNTTRDRCKEKVDAVSTFTFYPDQLFDGGYLNNLYTQVSLYVGAYLTLNSEWTFLMIFFVCV